MIPLSFAGHELLLLPEAALFWPARRALVLADLHFEKASWYAAQGQMLPPYDSLATLSAIAALTGRLDAQEVWCLGDSFHDDGGTARLPDPARRKLSDLTGKLRWTWITGNHDSAPEDRLGGEIFIQAEVDGLVLRHEADPSDPRPELSGHFHPKLRLMHRGRNVSRRCFVHSKRKIILPAFGALTGGLDARHPEIGRAIGGRREAIVALPGRLLRFPLSGNFTEL